MRRAGGLRWVVLGVKITYYLPSVPLNYLRSPMKWLMILFLMYVFFFFVCGLFFSTIRGRCMDVAARKVV